MIIGYTHQWKLRRFLVLEQSGGRSCKFTVLLPTGNPGVTLGSQHRPNSTTEMWHFLWQTLLCSCNCSRERAGAQLNPLHLLFSRLPRWLATMGCRAVWPSSYSGNTEKRSLQFPTLVLGETDCKKDQWSFGICHRTRTFHHRSGHRGQPDWLLRTPPPQIKPNPNRRRPADERRYWCLERQASLASLLSSSLVLKETGLLTDWRCEEMNGSC